MLHAVAAGAATIVVVGVAVQGAALNSPEARSANATRQRLAAGSCSRSAAFDGLCPWAAVASASAAARWAAKAKASPLASVIKVEASHAPVDSRMKHQLRFALLSFSDRPALSRLTRPSLRRFAEIAGRYDLLLEEEPLLDHRDFHPAWNKLAYARRALVLGSYDAVVCVDDDIYVSDPRRDPIYRAMVTHFFTVNGSKTEEGKKLVLASLDEQVDARVPLNTGVLALKGDKLTLELIDEVFRLGRRLKLVNGYTWLPRVSGLWDQDGFAEYIHHHGGEHFALVPHRVLQSFVRRGHSQWHHGDFAAHFTGLADIEATERVQLIAGFIAALAE